MFVQVSKERFLRKRDIVGVFDLDTSTVSGVTKNFLSGAEKGGRTFGIGSLPRSFVLDSGGRVYFSANMTEHIKNSVYQQSGN